MPESAMVQLTEAVARNTAAVLSLPSAGMLRHQKSRFLAMQDDGLWLECSPADRHLIDELIGLATVAGISFKTGVVKTVFATPILERSEAYQINADTAVHAVRVKLPTQIKQMQRRQNYRVRVPADSDLRLSVWRIPMRARLVDRPSATLAVNAQLLDISVGGIGVMFIGKDDEPPVVCEQDRLRIELIASTDEPLILEGEMRFPLKQSDPSKLRAGIAFRELETDLTGRQLIARLTRIVGTLQREEARRARLGVH